MIFNTHQQISTERRFCLKSSNIPTSGDFVYNCKNKQFILASEIGNGGEAIVSTLRTVLGGYSPIIKQLSVVGMGFY